MSLNIPKINFLNAQAKKNGVGSNYFVMIILLCNTEAGNSATNTHHVYSVAFTEPTMGIRIASMPDTDAPMVGEVQY